MGGWGLWWGWGVKGCVSHDILYLLIICQMSKCQTPWLWRRFEKKKLDIMRFQTLWGQIWPHMWMSPKTPRKHILWTFCSVLMIIKSDLKIDLIISEPHYVKFFFVNLLHRPGVWHFDIWQIISLMSDLMSDLVSDLVSDLMSDLVSEQIFIFFKFFKFFKILLFNIF